MAIKMTSNRSYLLRAMYDWICDNGLTVHVLVNAGHVGVEVPQEFVEDGQIVLNITPGAVNHFAMSQMDIRFSARFRGIPRDIVVPVGAVMAIFAKENGQGMAFDATSEPDPDPEPPREKPASAARSHLKVVK